MVMVMADGHDDDDGGWPQCRRGEIPEISGGSYCHSSRLSPCLNPGSQHKIIESAQSNDAETRRGQHHSLYQCQNIPLSLVTAMRVVEYPQTKSECACLQSSRSALGLLELDEKLMLLSWILMHGRK